MAHCHCIPLSHFSSKNYLTFLDKSIKFEFMGKIYYFLFRI